MSMKLSKVYNYRPVDNQSVVAEEEMGFASRMIPRHQTSLTSDTVGRVKFMSILEVIN